MKEELQSLLEAAEGPPDEKETWDVVLRFGQVRQSWEDETAIGFVLALADALRKHGQPYLELQARGLIQGLLQMRERKRLNISAHSRDRLWELYGSTSVAKHGLLHVALSDLISHNPEVFPGLRLLLESDDKDKYLTALSSLHYASERPPVDWEGLLRKWRSQYEVYSRTVGIMALYADKADLVLVEAAVPDLSLRNVGDVVSLRQ